MGVLLLKDRIMTLDDRDQMPRFREADIRTILRVFEVNRGPPLVGPAWWLRSVIADVGWPGCGSRRRYGHRA